MANRRIQVGLVKSTGGSILARQTKEGKINLLGLLNPPAAKPAATNNAAPSEVPWTVLLKEIAFDGYAIRLEDQKLAKPASLSFDQLGFNVKGLSTVSNAPIIVSLSLRLNEAGTVTAQGTAKISPPMADVELNVSGLDLRPFQPYLNEQMRLAVTSGRFNTRGRVRYTPAGSGAPLLRFAGEMGLTNLVTSDQVLFKEFVKWEALNVTGIDFDLQPNQLQVQEVKWRGLQTSVIIGPDQRPNLKDDHAGEGDECPRGSAAPPPPPQPQPPRQPRRRRKPASSRSSSARSCWRTSSFHFEDESIEPHCGFDVQELSGTVKGLSSQEQSTATVDLHGKVDAVSPFAISGKVNPLAKDLQLDLGGGVHQYGPYGVHALTWRSTPATR